MFIVKKINLSIADIKQILAEKFNIKSKDIYINPLIYNERGVVPFQKVFFHGFDIQFKDEEVNKNES